MLKIPETQGSHHTIRVSVVQLPITLAVAALTEELTPYNFQMTPLPSKNLVQGCDQTSEKMAGFFFRKDAILGMPTEKPEGGGIVQLTHEIYMVGLLTLLYIFELFVCFFCQRKMCYINPAILSQTLQDTSSLTPETQHGDPKSPDFKSVTFSKPPCSISICLKHLFFSIYHQHLLHDSTCLLVQASLH